MKFRSSHTTWYSQGDLVMKCRAARQSQSIQVLERILPGTGRVFFCRWWRWQWWFRSSAYRGIWNGCSRFANQKPVRPTFPVTPKDLFPMDPVQVLPDDDEGPWGLPHPEVKRGEWRGMENTHGIRIRFCVYFWEWHGMTSKFPERILFKITASGFKFDFWSKVFVVGGD